MANLTQTHRGKRGILLVTDFASFIGIEFPFSDASSDVFAKNGYIRVLNDQAEGLFLDDEDKYVKTGRFSLVKYDTKNSPWVFVPPRGATLVTEFVLQENMTPHHYIVVKSRNENALEQRAKVLRDICLDKDIEIEPYSKRRRVFKRGDRIVQSLETIARGGVMVNSIMGDPSTGFNLGVTVIGEPKEAFLDVIDVNSSGLTSILIATDNPETESEVSQPLWNFLKSLGSSHLHIGTSGFRTDVMPRRGEEEEVPLEVLTPGALSPFLLTGGDLTSSIYSVLRDFSGNIRLESGLMNLIKNTNADSFNNVFDYLKSLDYSDKEYLESIFTKVYDVYKNSNSNYVNVLLNPANSALYHYDEGNLSFVVPDSWDPNSDHELAEVNHRAITNILVQLLFYVKNRNTVMRPIHTTVIDNISHPALLSNNIFCNTLNKVMGEEGYAPGGVLLMKGDPRFLPRGLNPDITVIKREVVNSSLDLLKMNRNTAAIHLGNIKAGEVLVKNKEGRIEQVRLHRT